MSSVKLPAAAREQKEHHSVRGQLHPLDLTQSPVWRSEELGQPIPASPHAVSVALPLWEHVVGYEEKRPAVMEKLSSGYPRFVIHPLVQKLAQWITPTQPALPFPSVAVARLCEQFVR